MTDYKAPGVETPSPRCLQSSIFTKRRPTQPLVAEYAFQIPTNIPDPSFNGDAQTATNGRPLTLTCARGGGWCPSCALERRKKALRWSLETVRIMAARRGGGCLSGEYVNQRKTLRWRCGEGHEWSAATTTIATGRWCPKCALAKCKGPSKRAVKSSIEAAHAVAERHGGCACLRHTNSRR